MKSHGLACAQRTCDYMRAADRQIKKLERENKVLRAAVKRAQQAATIGQKDTDPCSALSIA